MAKNAHLESLLVVLIEEGSLCMTDMEVPTGLGREPHNHLTHFSPGQLHKLAPFLSLAPCSGGFAWTAGSFT